MTAHFSSPVDEAGTPIGLPPLHVHHVHLEPSPTSYESANYGASCLVWGQDCSEFSVLVQHHGDHQCLGQEGGTDCFISNYGRHPKLVNGKLSIVSEFNDVRDLGSEPLVWYYQVSLRIDEDHTDGSALSSHYITNNGRLGLESATAGLGLNQLPTRVDSFHFHTSRMPFAGTLVFAEYHAHARAFQRSLLFAATTGQLGLDRASFFPAIPYKSVVTSTTGLANNSVLEAELMLMLRAASSVTAASKLFGPTSKPERGSEPHLVCTADGRLERVDGTWYDRQAKLLCEPWAFSEGAIYTVVQLNGPTSATDKKGFDGMARRLESLDATIEYDFGQHDHWIIWYAANDGLSHYTIAANSQTIDTVSPSSDRNDLLRTLIHGSTPNSRVGPAERAILALIIFLLFLSSTPFWVQALEIAKFPTTAVGVWQFTRRRGYGRCASHAAVALVLTIMLYFDALVFYVFLPTLVIAPQQDAKLLATGAFYANEKNAAIVQLVVSIGVVSGGVACVAMWQKAHEAKASLYEGLHVM